MKTFRLDDLFDLPYMGRCKVRKMATEYHEWEDCPLTNQEDRGMDDCRKCAYVPRRPEEVPARLQV